MLSRKTLRVAGAAMLGTMALMATNVANAVIVAGKTTPATTHADVKFAKEGLTDTDATTHTKNEMKYYLVENNPDGDLNMVGVTELAPSASLPIYLRFELENMVFGGAFTTTTGHSGGGGVGDNFLVVAYNSGTATEARTIDPNAIGVRPGMSGSVTVTAHVSALDALRSLNPIASVTQVAEDAVMVVDGISEMGESSMTVADVETQFAKFVSGEGGSIGATATPPYGTTIATIGKLTVGAVDGVLARDGTDGTVANLLAGAPAAPITITYKGDFSEHTYSVNMGDDCAETIVAATLNDAKTELVPDTQPTADVEHYLCVKVDDDNKMAITEMPFTATVKYAGVTDAAMPRMEMTETVGTIMRNGTTVHIPYMTTYEGYNQRLVVSNRSGVNALYEITFRPEMGVTATPTDMASGTLMAGSTVTYRARDLVTLEGGSRTAATISIAAPMSSIDVSSVIVNRESRDTDTVVHHSGM